MALLKRAFEVNLLPDGTVFANISTLLDTLSTENNRTVRRGADKPFSLLTFVRKNGPVIDDNSVYLVLQDFDVIAGISFFDTFKKDLSRKGITGA